MSRWLPNLLGSLAVIVLILTPLAFARHGQAQIRNFRVVHEGVLYRSGQMSLDGLKRIVHDYRIKTIISLRDAHSVGSVPPDQAEEEYCSKEEINFTRLSPRHWEGAPGEPPPVEENVRAFRAIMEDPKNYPVLVHCFAGVHRSGAYCAIYRMEQEHWSNEQAIAEMRAVGYLTLDEDLDILAYLDHYRPTWQRPKQQESFDAGENP
jgi:protein tyrosine/serine phosphatase